MGRLRDLIFQDTGFLEHEKPDPFTQRQASLEDSENRRKFSRKEGFIKNTLMSSNLTRAELVNVIRAVNPDESAVDKLLSEARKTGIYKNRLVQIMQKVYPNIYKAAKDAGMTEPWHFVQYAEHHLPPAQVEKVLVAGMLQEMLRGSKAPQYLGALEQGLSKEHLELLTEKLETYKDPTDIPVEERGEHYLHEACEKLKAQADTAFAGQPDKQERYRNALKFADDHLIRLPSEHHDMMRNREADIQGLGAANTKGVRKTQLQTYQNGRYDGILATEPGTVTQTKSYIAPGKEEVVKDLNQGSVHVSERMKEGIRKMVRKMQEMELLGPGEVAPGEDPYKIYGFRKYTAKKQAFEQAVQEGNAEAILTAGEEFQKVWQDMEELYTIARENFHLDSTLFPGNLDSCRNANLPAQFTFDLAATAAVNGAFLVYNLLQANNIDLEEYLENPMGKAYGTYQKNIEQNNLDHVTQGQSFETTLDCLYDFRSSNSDIFMTKTFDLGVARGLEFLTYCDPDLEKAQENTIRGMVYGDYNTSLYNNMKEQFGSLRSRKSPEAVNRTLQNLITVTHGDVPVSQLIDGKNVRLDLSRGEDFSLDHYAAEHADYEGMISRTEALLDKVKKAEKDEKVGIEYTGDVLEAAQDAYIRILKTHKAEMDSPGYKKLQAAFLGLESKLPENAPRGLRNRLASRREELSMDLPEGPATSMWTEQYMDQLAEKGQNLSMENAAQLRNINEALKDLRTVTAPYYIADEMGEFPIVKGEDFQKLQDAYIRVTDALGKFEPDQTNPVAVNISEMLGGLKTVMGQDMTALSAARQGQEASLSDMLKQGRSLKVTVNGPITTVGDAASSRMRIDVPGPGGTTVKGFFTANSATYTREQADQMLDRGLNQVIEKYGHPEVKEALQTLIKSEIDALYSHQRGDYLGNIIQLMNASRKKLRQGTLEDQFAGFVNKNCPNVDPEIKAFLKSEEGSGMILDALKEVAPLSMMAEFDASGLEGNIDRRNSAMSTMAELLGVGNVIAGSRPMTIVHDGKEITGTFMNFAEGWDMTDFRPENPLNNVGPGDMMSAESLEALANLQTLDFICGNVDRHDANMFYKFDDGQPPKFMGVQGIDNDFSFCLNYGNNSVRMEDLCIVTEKTAQKIMSLTPSLLETTLSPYGLSKEEIDAAWTRTHNLQQKITENAEYFKDKAPDYVEKGRIRVVKEENLAKFQPDSSLFSTGLFSRAVHAPSSHVNRQAMKNEALLDERFKTLRETAPDMQRILNGVEDANRGFFIGSKAYRNAMRGVREMAAARNGYLNGADPEALTEYQQKLEDAKQRIAAYLEYKTKIPPERRNALENRRIKAMSDAFTVLDKESLVVADAASLAAKVEARRELTGPLVEKQKKLSVQSDLIQMRIEARVNREKLMNKPDELEGKTMRTWRENTRESMYSMQITYDGSKPTPEMMAQLPEKLSRSAAYVIMKMYIRQIQDPKEKEAVYRKLDEKPSIMENLAKNVRNVEAFKNTIKERFGPDGSNYLEGIKGGLGGFGSVMGQIRSEVTQKLREDLVTKREEPTRQVQPRVSQVEKPNVQMGSPMVS